MILQIFDRKNISQAKSELKILYFLSKNVDFCSIFSSISRAEKFMMMIHASDKISILEDCEIELFTILSWHD